MTIIRIIKRLSVLLILCLCIFACISQPVLALEESDVQAQVDIVGRETVVGNVLIWFLSAIAFLKISQKIDSILSSLGLNVVQTGSSLMSEAYIAMRALSSLSRVRGNGGSSGSSSGTSTASSFFSGGLAGIINRSITSGAANSVVNCSDGSSPGGIGGNIYSSSVTHGGNFANTVIGSIATGSIRKAGSITGEQAVSAINSYMGISALGPDAADSSFSNVEIGGGRITGTEVNPEHPEGIAFGMYHASQYAAPDGEYTTVHSADGEAWYKQYAVDAVQRIPYKAPDGAIAYQEAIIKKLPPVPPRKDRL